MMNKHVKKLLYLGCLVASASLNAQNGVKATLSAPELKLLSAEKPAPKPVITAAQKQAAKENAQASAVFLTRAILHKKNPERYPLDLKNEAEKKAFEAVNKLPSSLLERASSNLVKIIADPKKKIALFGKFQGVDFSMNVVSSYMKNNGWTLSVNTRPPLKLAGEDRFRFIFRKLVCVNECDPEDGSDQMIVGGVLVGPGENVRLANSLVSCALESGESCDHNDYFFGGFPLSPASSYPQSFYCIVVLAKTEDADLQAQTAELNAALQSVVASTYNTSSNPGDIANGLEFSLNIMMSIYTNEKVFSAETLYFTMSNANSLGSDNQSDEFTTGNIEDHGGRYKFKYLWKRAN
jgi:hypothetical protein